MDPEASLPAEFSAKRTRLDRDGFPSILEIPVVQTVSRNESQQSDQLGNGSFNTRLVITQPNSKQQGHEYTPWP